jgi:alkanesulfonate monooxygenase SsuD/methylene tetrahydromethanopterin reductase-like flavin-dependent oxidoreductase (luciferase family)
MVEFGYYILNTHVPELEGSAADVYNLYFEQIEAAEAVGFDHVWVTEHHFDYFGGLTPSPQMLMTALSQRTKRLRLGVSVSILPLHHPLSVAEDFAVVDVLSGGRLEFGAGRGMPRSGFQGFGISQDGAQERTKEALTLIDRVWREPNVAFEGEYYRCPAVTVLPRPVQQPRPPIWMTANIDPASFQWVGEQGYDLMTIPWLFPAEAARERVAQYQAARAAAGHPGPGRVLVMYPAHVADSAEQAQAQALVAWNNWRDFITAHVSGLPARAQYEANRRAMLEWDNMIAERRAIFGGVEECVATTRHLAEYFGITHFGLTFHFGGLNRAAGLRAVELWGREVAPRLRAAQPAPAAP